jgi:predicted aspartyl protease
MSLADFLEATGYSRIPLSRNGVGHFEAGGTLAGRPIRVLIDTGAASTVVSLALAQEMGLRLTPLGPKGGGAGAAQLDVSQLHDAELKLGDVKPGADVLYAMDLSHVNAALALKGTTPVDVILGVDVFQKQAAVIDYGSNSLYLRPA